jgi:hypothetical protein
VSSGDPGGFTIAEGSEAWSGWRQTESEAGYDRSSAVATNRLDGLMSDVVEFAEVAELFDR